MGRKVVPTIGETCHSPNIFVRQQVIRKTVVLLVLEPARNFLALAVGKADVDDGKKAPSMFAHVRWKSSIRASLRDSSECTAHSGGVRVLPGLAG